VKLLGILFLFFGYVFVYASVAAGGRFATEPWAALFADAYTDAFAGALAGSVNTVGQDVGRAITSAGQQVGGQ
jgi:hypothetical protein